MNRFSLWKIEEIFIELFDKIFLYKILYNQILQHLLQPQEGILSCEESSWNKPSESLQDIGNDGPACNHRSKELFLSYYLICDSFSLNMFSNSLRTCSGLKSTVFIFDLNIVPNDVSNARGKKDCP